MGGEGHAALRSKSSCKGHGGTWASTREGAVTWHFLPRTAGCGEPAPARGVGGGGAAQPSGLQRPTVRQGEWFPHSGAGAQGRKSPPAPSMGITRHLQAQKGETKQTERLRSVPAEGSRCKSIYKCHKRSNPKELLMAFCSENKGVHSNSVSCHCSDKERLSLTSSSLQKIRGT